MVAVVDDPHDAGMTPLPRERALDLLAVKVDERRLERGFWPKLKRVAPKIPFLSDLVAVYYCTRDPSTPAAAKALLMAALAYFVLPFDAVPDMLAGVGFTDDAAVIAAVLATLGGVLKSRHREAARAFIDRLARDA
jgi:uncharacterized membrane protein YkvA (DUF1232 family)